MQEIAYDTPEPGIAVMFDVHDPDQAALLHALKSSFGEPYARVVDLDLSRHRCLLLRPGGARAVRAGASQT